MLLQNKFERRSTQQHPPRNAPKMGIGKGSSLKIAHDGRGRRIGRNPAAVLFFNVYFI